MDVNWLQKIRNEQNVSQKKLGQLCDIGATGVSMIETGKRKPSVNLAKKMANALNFDKYNLTWTIFFEDNSHDLRLNSKSEGGVEQNA